MKFYDRNYSSNKKMYDSDKIGPEKFIDEFIKQYEPPYFIGNKPEQSALGRKIRQNSRIAEEEMQILLDKGITSSEDVIKILDWKIGKIDHAKSESDGTVCYKDIPSVHFTVHSMYDKPIEVKPLCEHIESDYVALNCKTPQEIYDNLLHMGVKGLGTVYLLTLVYFISGGKSPIYDRFAHQALEALQEGLEPKMDEVTQRTVPDKNNKKAFKWFESQYSRSLKQMFPNDYTDRKLDRALWIYGHLFKVKNK